MSTQKSTEANYDGDTPPSPRAHPDVPTPANHPADNASPRWAHLGGILRGRLAGFLGASLAELFRALIRNIHTGFETRSSNDDCTIVTTNSDGTTRNVTKKKSDKHTRFWFNGGQNRPARD